MVVDIPESTIKDFTGFINSTHSSFCNFMTQLFLNLTIQYIFTLFYIVIQGCVKIIPT